MIIHVGKLSIQTDNITYTVDNDDDTARIFFIDGKSIDLDAESSRIFFDQLDSIQADILNRDK